MKLFDRIRNKKNKDKHKVKMSESKKTDNYKPISNSGFTTQPLLKNTYRNRNPSLIQYLPENKNDIVQINFDLVQIQEYSNDVTFFLANTLDITNNNDIFFIQVSIPLIENQIFTNKIVIQQAINKFDRLGINLGRFLNKYLNWKTNETYFRGLRLTIDENRSKNFNLKYITTRKIEVSVGDIFNLSLDWKNRKAIIRIDKEKVEKFQSIFFINVEKNSIKKEKNEIIETVEVKGFDKSGEPVLELYSNNNLYVKFNFMPPLNGQNDQSELKIFDNFDTVLSEIVDKKIVWEDRELFLIKKSDKKDMFKIVKYLQGFWDKK